MTLRPARRRRYALSQYATVRGFSLWQQEWFGFFFPRRRRRPTNKEFLGRVDTFMADSSGKIAQGAHQMDESVQVMQGATGRFQSMASIISSIVKAQKGLKDIRL